MKENKKILSFINMFYKHVRWQDQTYGEKTPSSFMHLYKTALFIISLGNKCL